MSTAYYWKLAVWLHLHHSQYHGTFTVKKQYWLISFFPIKPSSHAGFKHSTTV